MPAPGAGVNGGAAGGSGGGTAGKIVLGVAALLICVFVGSLLELDLRPKNVHEHMANSTEFAEGTAAQSYMSSEASKDAAAPQPATEEERPADSPLVHLDEEQVARLVKLGYTTQSIEKMKVMPRNNIVQVLEFHRQEMEQNAAKLVANHAQPLPDPVPTAAKSLATPTLAEATELPVETVPEVAAPIVAPLATPKVLLPGVSDKYPPELLPTPSTKKFDIATLRAMKPPEYCHTAVNGEKGEPTTTRMKQPPSERIALRIAELIAEDRPCWIYNRDCARKNATGLNGKPFWKKPNVTLEQMWENITPEEKGSLGTCAMVGNADNLSGKGWGKQIDAHDFVVRYNVRIKGYEQDVGSRIDGLWSKENYKSSDQVMPSRYHMIPKTPPRNLAPIDGIPVMVYGSALPRWRAVAKEIYTIYKKDQKITKGEPTGGWARMTSLVESGLCTRVDIYGFSSGGGKYFKRSEQVKQAHVVNIEHYTRRLMMALQLRGKVCVYGA